MKALIVHAHENPDSFCSAIAHQTENVLAQLGYKVIVSDLYKMGFDPVGSQKDFQSLSGIDYYKYASEQLHASKNKNFSPELNVEMNKLIEADVINFNFPLWWFDMPAILKGWVDRVLAYGVAYGGNYGFGESGRFNGRKAFLSITTGSPKENYSKEGSNKRPLPEILRNINEGIFELVGYEVLEPFIAYGVSRISQEDRENILKANHQYLEKYLSLDHH